jgi:hypothetical protein
VLAGQLRSVHSVGLLLVLIIMYLLVDYECMHSVKAVYRRERLMLDYEYSREQVGALLSPEQRRGLL